MKGKAQVLNARVIEEPGEASDADTSAVPDEEMRKPPPLLARDELREVALDLDRIFLTRQTESLRQPADMRVDDDALRVPAFGRDDVGRLARHARQPQQRVE